MIYALSVELEKNVAIPTKFPPILKQQSHTEERQEVINPKKRPWMKQCCLRDKNNKVLLFHTPSSKYHQFPTPFQPKGKNGDMRKKGVLHWKQEEKNRKYVKIKQIN